MTGWSVTATAGLIGALLVGRPSVGLRRLASPSAPGSLRRSISATSSESWLTSAGARRVTAVAAGLLVALLAFRWWGWVLGAVVAVSLERWFGTLPDRASVANRQAFVRALPLALDLMAAALTAGATVDAALVLAARVAGPPVDGRLLEVATSIRLGASPEEAWSVARDDPVLRPVARLAVRSAASGAAMAAACRDLAVRSREAAVADADAAIKRAGVLSVLPLALCLLPAFILVGVVPVVVGLLGSLAL